MHRLQLPEPNHCDPLCLVPSALEQFKITAICTKLDFQIAYNLGKIRESDQQKTAFNTTRYECLVMLHGLVNASSVFLAFINDILTHAQKCMIAYIDGNPMYPFCVEMDKAKVRATAELPIPQITKQLQRFLGFVNFFKDYLKFKHCCNSPHSTGQESIKETALEQYYCSILLDPYYYDVRNMELLAEKLILEERSH